MFCAVPGYMSTILPWFTNGGPFIVPIVLAGVIGLILLIERGWYVSARSRVHAAPFTEEIVSLARAGETEEALRLCAGHKAALADLGLVVLRTDSVDRDMLRDVASAASLSILPPQRRSVRWLTTFTLMVLILGGVGAIANLHAVSGTGTVMSALAYALRPVGAALLITLPLVAGTAFVAAESARLAGQLEDFASRLVSAVTDGPDVRLGHRT
jgi:biopolymer transport protein ExbB